MVKILSFLRLELGKTMDVVRELKLIKNVKEIYYITGEFDLVMIIEGSSSEELHDIIVKKIDIINGILQMSSHLLVKRWTFDSD